MLCWDACGGFTDEASVFGPFASEDSAVAWLHTTHAYAHSQSDHEIIDERFDIV